MLFVPKTLNIDVGVFGSLAHLRIIFSGPFTQASGDIDLSNQPGNHNITFHLVTLIEGLRFFDFWTSNRDTVYPQHWPDLDPPPQQFRRVAISDTEISFDYRNQGPNIYNSYAVELKDGENQSHLIDPKIKNGPTYEF